jgi:ATP-dependent Clp protease ATP-binding subunit ClpC
MGYKIKLDEAARDYIVEKGYDSQFGARPLKRAIQKYIEDPLAEEIINSSLKEGDTIYLDLEEGKEELSVNIKKAKATKQTLPPFFTLLWMEKLIT